MKNIFFLGCSLLANVCFAQFHNDVTLGRSQKANELQMKSFEKVNEGRFLAYQINGMIDDGKRREAVVTYDAYQDDLILRLPEGKDFIVQKGAVASFQFIDSKGVRRFKFLQEVPEVDFCYAEILDENPKFSLYLRHKRIQNIDIGKNGYDASLPFTTDDAFIWVAGNKKIYTTGKKKEIERLLTEAYPEKKVAIAALLKEHNTKTPEGAERLAMNLKKIL